MAKITETQAAPPMAPTSQPALPADPAPTYSPRSHDQDLSFIQHEPP